MDLDVDVGRYLTILDRRHEWVVERGEYTFVVAEDGGDHEEEESTGGKLNVTLVCV